MNKNVLTCCITGCITELALSENASERVRGALGVDVSISLSLEIRFWVDWSVTTHLCAFLGVVDKEAKAKYVLVGKYYVCVFVRTYVLRSP